MWIYRLGERFQKIRKSFRTNASIRSPFFLAASRAKEESFFFSVLLVVFETS